MRSSQGHEQQRAIFDAKFLFRRLPGVVSPVDWDTWGHHYPQPARPGDREPILDLVLRWEGEASAAIAARWWERQPDGFFVVRGHNGAVGGFLARRPRRASPVAPASQRRRSCATSKPASSGRFRVT
jgi:hypothetical protein